MLPSTKINRGSQHVFFDTNSGQFIIDESAQQTSGIGIEAGIAASLLHPLTENARLIFNAGLSGRHYIQNPAFNSVSSNFSVAYEVKAQKQLWNFGIFSNGTLLKSGDYTSTIGAKALLRQQFSENSIATFELGYAFLNHVDSPNETGPRFTESLTI